MQQSRPHDDRSTLRLGVMQRRCIATVGALTIAMWFALASGTGEAFVWMPSRILHEQYQYVAIVVSPLIANAFIAFTHMRATSVCSPHPTRSVRCAEPESRKCIY